MDSDAPKLDVEAILPRRPRPPSLGTLLLLLGAGVWGSWALLRSHGTPQLPWLTAVDAPRVHEDLEPRPPAVPVVPRTPVEKKTAEKNTEPTFDEPKRVRWDELRPPAEVTYTIKRGGTLRRVANLFKVYHHEIRALNPGIDLDAELPPQRKVVLYRAPQGADGKVDSESVGTPSHGSIIGAVPMPEGPGRIIRAIGWKTWGTASTVALVDGVMRQWAKTQPNRLPILIGNMSAPGGGRLPPHSTHQSGRDVDLGYPQVWRGPDDEYNWREMTADNLDTQGTWELVKLLLDTGAVEVIIVDRSLQKLMHRHALEHHTLSSSELARVLEYPGRPSGDALIQHVDGHTDHMHVRFVCPPEQRRCESGTHS